MNEDEVYSEKRVFPRCTLRTKVILEDEFGEGFIYFYTTDVSLGGLFFESEIPLKQGTKIFLSFSLPDMKKKVRATGQVVRLEKLETIGARVTGFGIHFLEISADDQRALEAFCATFSTKV
jgi:uncharacterized protein (TIGR02266 family)